MAKTYVFNFDQGGIGDITLLGDKGANLAQINQLGLNIPFGFTITTDGCKYFLEKGSIPNDLLEQIMRGLKSIEKVSSMRFGDTSTPLLLSIRTGSNPTIKGLSKTIINLGMNDTITSHLIRQSKNPVFAWECYSRFVKDYCTIVAGIDNALGVQDADNTEPSSISATAPFLTAGTVPNKASDCNAFNKSSFP